MVKQRLYVVLSFIGRSWRILPFLLMVNCVILLIKDHHRLNYDTWQNQRRPVAKSLEEVNERTQTPDVFCFDRYGKPIRRQEVQMQPNQFQRKNVHLTIGIPTIRRNSNGKKAYYLKQTLHSLLTRLSETDKTEISIVILCADEKQENRLWIKQHLEREFPDQAKDGLLQMIHIPERFYMRLDNLPRTYNDTQHRVKWRSKQSLDYAFLSYYAYGLSPFYLSLEDDVKSKDKFYDIIKSENRDCKGSFGEGCWIMKRYYKGGFIGKLMQGAYLKSFADYLRLFYAEMPLDWIYEYWLLMIDLTRDREWRGSQSLFTHIGEQSSSKNS